MQILLFQIRDDAETRREEHATFARACGMRVEDVISVNVLRDALDEKLFLGKTAAIIGGASGFSAYQNYEWTNAFGEWIEVAYRLDFPIFGSCWGHQFLARVFGGTVIHDAERAEMGTKAIELTELGRKDALFSFLPHVFLANHGHHDRVSVLPDDAVELAFNESSPYQAFRIANKQIYGTQFHPELDKTTITNRLKRYRKHYPESGDDASFAALLASFQDTPDAAMLLQRFLAHVR